MSYEEFKSEIRAGLPRSLYVLEGPEDYLKERCAADAKKRLVDPALESFNFQSFSEAPEVSAVKDFVASVPMMSERKLLILRRCGLFAQGLRQKAEWAKLFASLPEHVCVLLWEDGTEKKKKSASPVQRAAEKAGTVVDFPLQTQAKLAPWLAKAAAKGGKLIDADCAGYIIAGVGRSMSALRSEMEKIAAYAPGRQITRADVDAVLVRPSEDRLFKLIDAIMEGRRDLCYGYICEMRQNRAKPAAVLWTFSDQLVGIYRARLLLSEELRQQAAARELMKGGIVPFVAEKSVRIASRSSEERLERLISLAREAERSIKQGKSEPWTAFEMLVAEMRI